jgi:hypothetical protein
MIRTALQTENMDANNHSEKGAQTSQVKSMYAGPWTTTFSRISVRLCSTTLSRL